MWVPKACIKGKHRISISTLERNEKYIRKGAEADMLRIREYSFSFIWK
jgi:hypothetical protein